MSKFTLRREKPALAPLRRLPEDELSGCLTAHQQWLESEESDPREGKPADFSNADLRGHDFTGANLKHANFRDADLRKANFSGADLTEAEFRGANLEEANLSGAVGLFAEQLSDTNLRRAKMPEKFKFEALDKVNALSKDAYPLFLTMLLACVYSWLTIASTKDPALLTNSGTSKLPVIDVEIPIVGFYRLAPLVLLGIYVYFHINLQRLWEAMAALPAIFPDGVTLDRKTDSWLLIDLVRRHYKYLKPSPPPLSWLQETLSLLLAWWIVPLTVAWFWLRYLARHEWRGTGMHIILLTAIVWAGITSYKLAIATLRADKKTLDVFTNSNDLPAPDELRADKQELSARQKILRGMRRLLACGLLVFVMWSLDWSGRLLFALLAGVIWVGIAYELKLVVAFCRADEQELNTRQKLLRGIFWLFGFCIRLLVCGLLAVVMSTMESPWLLIPLLAIIIWAGMALYLKLVVDCRHADHKAFEARQKLRKTHRLFGFGVRITACAALFTFISVCAIYSPPVEKRDYYSVPVEDMRLPNGDDMPEAMRAHNRVIADPFANDNRPGLWVAKAFNLVGYSPVANLRSAKVSTGDADNLKSVTGANLRDTNLNSAQCQNAMLAKASFINANLSGAVLDDADLEKAVFFNADLSNATLKGANLQGALILNAKLQGASWKDADLRHANMCQAVLRDADLKNTKLQGALLVGADLSRARLDGANLAGATFSGPATDGSTLYADLRGTDLRKTQGLTVKQIRSALIGTDRKTKESLLSVEDLQDADGLIGRLRKDQGPLSHYLRGQFFAAFREQFKESNLYIGDSQPLRQPLVDELNRIIQDKPLYDKASFAKVKLGSNTLWQMQEMQRQMQWHQQGMQRNLPPNMNPPDKNLIRVNRLLLADAYPGHIVNDPETKLPSYLHMTAAQIEAALHESQKRADNADDRERTRQENLQNPTLGPM